MQSKCFCLFFFKQLVLLYKKKKKISESAEQQAAKACHYPLVTSPELWSTGADNKQQRCLSVGLKLRGSHWKCFMIYFQHHLPSIYTCESEVKEDHKRHVGVQAEWRKGLRQTKGRKCT